MCATSGNSVVMFGCEHDIKLPKHNNFTIAGETKMILKSQHVYRALGKYDRPIIIYVTYKFKEYSKPKM